MDKVILIVDDQASNLAVLKGVLTPTGHQLVFAKDGEGALEAVARHRPDLILLDIMMPRMDGYEVCRRLKADPATATIPVIFVTANGEIEDESRGFEVGAVDYITKPISPRIVRQRVETHLSLVHAQSVERLARAAIGMLGRAGHYNDDATGVHIWRMAAYARALAEAAGWPADRAEMLELAAPMHDTGKIGIPDAILKAPRPLEDDEWIVMKTHAQIGFDILSEPDHPVFWLGAEIALGHHEKWDGSGYPRGLAGDAIPESARIVAIADVFDALTMKRPYKEAWSVEKALEQIERGAGSHFEPRLAAHFLVIEEKIRHIRQEWDEKEE